MIYVCLLKIDNQIETFFLTLANELTVAETKDGFGCGAYGWHLGWHLPALLVAHHLRIKTSTGGTLI